MRRHARQRLGDIGLFKVVGEGAVSSGVRRVEALTGEAARAYLTGRDDRLREAAAALEIDSRRSALARCCADRGSPASRARTGRCEEGAGAWRRRFW
ncbi:hypothetical protein [Sphingomonas aerolata]|uniref:hypothetical protein n=1 Tax=Sphingomonas aerolata TaxID=185951 RepID=UPI003A5BE3E4